MKFLVILGMCIAKTALPCSMVPRDLARPYSQVVAEAEHILLVNAARVSELDSDELATSTDAPDSPNTLEALMAKVNSSRGRHTHKYAFDVIEVIYGDSPVQTIEIVGTSPHDISVATEHHSFDNHTIYEFWLNRGGRIRVRGDCEIVPHFSIGKEYLLVLGPKKHYKSYEMITSEEDAWLAEVRILIGFDSLRDSNIDSSE